MMLADCKPGDLVVLDVPSAFGSYTYVQLGGLLYEGRATKKKLPPPWCALVTEVDHETLFERVGPGFWRAVSPDIVVLDIVEPYSWRYRMRFERRRLADNTEVDPMMRQAHDTVVKLHVEGGP